MQLVLVLPTAIVDVKPVPQALASHDGTSMFPMVLTSACGMHATLCADEAASREDWLRAICDVLDMQSQGRWAVPLGERFALNPSGILGTGLFAVVATGQHVQTGTTLAVKASLATFCWNRQASFASQMESCFAPLPNGPQVIKPKAFHEYRSMLNREMMVWSAAGSHPYILRLRDVLVSDTRMFFASGETESRREVRGLYKAFILLLNLL